MSFISDQELNQLRSRSDITEIIGERIPLKRAGRNLKGVCPFHAEKTPSFMVHPDKQIYHCFGCGAGGDVFSFLMKYDGLEFVEAVERLAERYGIVLKTSGEDGVIRRTRAEKDLLLRINRLAARYYAEVLARSEQGQRGRDYLKGREIGDSCWGEAMLGYAPSGGRSLVRFFEKKGVPVDGALKLGLLRRGANGDLYDFFRDRLLFSVVTADGRVLGFSGRTLDDQAQPKYVNSPESPVYQKSDSLLGLQTARPSIREADQVILVEGNFDMLRLHQAGLRQVVAPLGTALTELQVRTLARMTRNFILLFDGDPAGRKAAFRALEIFLPMGLNPKVVLLPEKDDPDTFVRREGLDSLKKMITLCPSLFDVRMEAIFEAHGRDPQGQTEAIREVADLIRLLPGDVEKNFYSQRVAQRFGLSDAVVSGLMSAPRRRIASSQIKTSNFSEVSGDDRERPVRLPPLERTILEVLMSGARAPEVLFTEIHATDFSSPEASELWEILKEEHDGHGDLDVGRLLTRFPEGRMRNLVTELSMRGIRWQEGGDRAAADCLRQLRVRDVRVRLQCLTTEIRRAEMEHNLGRIQELMDQKNELIKAMTSVH